MFGRETIKSTLRAVGIFPAVRYGYRKLAPGIRRQHAKELEFCRSILRPGSLCFDVGANLGQRTELFLELGCRVILLEPNANCIPTLDYQFRNNPNVTIVRSAVGSRAGKVNLYSKGTSAASSVRPDWNQKVFGSDYQTSVSEVPITTLDSLVAKFGKPDFVKVDVEGFETEVLKGLSTPVPLLSFEFHSSELDRAAECLDLLRKLGHLKFRLCDMECNWVTPTLENEAETLAIIEKHQLKGDFVVWIE